VLTTDPAVIAGAPHAMRVNPVVAELVELCVKHTLPWRRARRIDVLHSLSRCGVGTIRNPSFSHRKCDLVDLLQRAGTHTRHQSRCCNTHVLRAPSSHVTQTPTAPTSLNSYDKESVIEPHSPHLVAFYIYFSLNSYDKESVMEPDADALGDWTLFCLGPCLLTTQLRTSRFLLGLTIAGTLGGFLANLNIGWCAATGERRDTWKLMELLVSA
jgi:hypothetical protein